MQRATRQKKAIRDVLEDAASPLTPPEICERARKQVPGLGIATVYRSLKALSEEGKVRTIEIPGEPPRYESAARGHHHHFLCRSCGTVFELAGCVADLPHLAPKNFSVEDHEIILYGHCASCKRSGKQGNHREGMPSGLRAH